LFIEKSEIWRSEGAVILYRVHLLMNLAQLAGTSRKWRGFGSQDASQ
jgi:hypothetical protein